MAKPAAGPPFRFRKLDHVVLRCSDVKAMERFYVDTIGASADWVDRFDGTLSHLRVGDSLIDLVDAESALSFGPRALAGEAPPSTLDHLALRCDDFDPAAAEDWLRGRGVEVIAAGTRYGADGEGYSIYVRDPEGNVVELKCGPLSV